MSEDEVAAYERWLEERDQRRHRAHVIEEEIRRYEEEQRHLRELSARTSSSGSESSSEETPTTSEEHKSLKAETSSVSDKRGRTESDFSGPFELDSGYGDSESDREHHRHHHHTPAKEIEHSPYLDHRQKEHLAVMEEKKDVKDLAQLHKKFVEEISSVQSDEDHYYHHYSRLDDEIKSMAEEAERLRFEAEQEAKELDRRAHFAE